MTAQQKALCMQLVREIADHLRRNNFKAAIAGLDMLYQTFKGWPVS